MTYTGLVLVMAALLLSCVNFWLFFIMIDAFRTVCRSIALIAQTLAKLELRDEERTRTTHVTPKSLNRWFSKN